MSEDCPPKIEEYDPMDMPGSFVFYREEMLGLSPEKLIAGVEIVEDWCFAGYQDPEALLYRLYSAWRNLDLGA